MIAHTSSESNTIVPIFTIAGDVAVPSPIFHSFIDVKKSDDGNFEVIGIADAINNEYLNGNLFIEGCERLKAAYPKTLGNLTKSADWKSFLVAVNLPEETKK